MFKLQNKTIHISRTESGILKVKRKNGSINDLQNAVNVLRVYETNGLDEIFLIEIPGTYNSTDDTIDFNLGMFTNSKKIELSNEPIEYWYELRINDKIILGYDESKAKLLIIYPAGKEETTE